MLHNSPAFCPRETLKCWLVTFSQGWSQKWCLQCLKCRKIISRLLCQHLFDSCRSLAGVVVKLLLWIPHAWAEMWTPNPPFRFSNYIITTGAHLTLCATAPTGVEVSGSCHVTSVCVCLQLMMMVNRIKLSMHQERCGCAIFQTPRGGNNVGRINCKLLPVNTEGPEHPINTTQKHREVCLCPPIPRQPESPSGYHMVLFSISLRCI